MLLQLWYRLININYHEKQNKLFLLKDQGFIFKVTIHQSTSISLSVTVNFIHKSERIYK